MKLFIPLTTVHPPALTTVALVNRLANESAKVIVAGDQQGSAEYSLDKPLISSPISCGVLLRFQALYRLSRASSPNFLTMNSGFRLQTPAFL